MHDVVGREYVLSVLTGYLDATLKGTGACVLLEGSIGIGKSRMLKEVALEGAERGLAVTYMRAAAQNEAEIVRELIIFLRHVTPGEVEFHDQEFQDLVRPDANPFLLADSLSEMIADAARNRPLLIILDDAQRVDQISSVALQGMVRSLASAPVLSLVARRPVPAYSLAQHAIGWLCEQANTHLRLGPLDNEAVSALCAGVLGAKPDSSVMAWAARCGGNPWLLENLMNAFAEAGRLVIVDGTASVLAESMPDSAMTAIVRMLDDVSPGVRDLLLRGGRVGPRFTVADVGAPDPALSAIADEAVQVGLITRNGDELEFVHEIVGEAINHVASGGPERSPLVSTMEDRQPAQAYMDSAQALAPLSPAALSPCSPAPGMTCGCAHVAARVTLALGEMLDAPRKLARALSLLAGVGRGAEAGQLADAVVNAGMDTADEARLVLELIPGLQNAGCAGMSVQRLRHTLARQDLRDPDRTRLEGLLVETADLVKSVRTSGGAVGYAPWNQRNHQEIDGHDGVVQRHEPGRPPCRTCGCPSWAWVVHALIAADQFEEAATVAAVIKQAAQQIQEPWPELQWHGHRAELLLTLGRLSEARVAAEAGLRLSEQSALEDSVPARAVLARIGLHYGDTATASEQLRLAERLVTDEATVGKTRLDWAFAQFHAACGRPEMAVRTLIEVDAKVAPDLLFFAEAPTAAAMLVRLARKTGLSAEAECATDLARRVTELNPEVASLAAGADHAEGLLRRDTDALRRAVESYRAGGRPLAMGIALEDTAQEEHNRRHQSQAVELLGSALELYTQSDARRDVARVQRKLRRLGVAHAGEPGGDRPTSGWESLTNAELRVVRAIVDGKTNKEAASMLFLSPHTVDSHLRRVFAKLGINTRVELTKHFLAHEAA